MKDELRKMTAMSAMAALLAFTAGCASFEEVQQVVDKLRILAIRADSPDVTVAIGPSKIPVFDPPVVNIDTVVADPKGAGRPVTVYMAVCAPMALDIVSNFDCDGENGFPIPGGVLNMFEYLQWVISVTPSFDPTQFVGGASPIDLSRGFPVLVWVRATAGDETAVGLKRITLKTSSERNHNPRFLGATIQDVPLTDGLFVRANQVFNFRPKIDPSSIETYHDPVSGQLTTETPIFVWYSSDGKFHNLYTNLTYSTTTWQSPILNDGEQSRTVEFWLIVLDDRGGIDWIDAGNISVVP